MKNNSAQKTTVTISRINTLPTVRQALDNLSAAHLSAIRANDVVALHYEQKPNTLAPLPDIQALAVALTNMVQAERALVEAIAANVNG